MRHDTESSYNLTTFNLVVAESLLFFWFSILRTIPDMKYKSLVFSLCLSASVYAWECPVCKKSFASVGFVAHTCDQSTVLPTQLTNLISNSGFAFHPSSRINALSIIGDYLEYLPLYEKDPDLPWSVTQWLYHWFDHLGLCEHGCGVGGSWSTADGESIKKEIKDYKKVIPEDDIEQTSTFEDHTIIDSFSDWYYGEGGMCGCGNPDEVFKLLHDALFFFQENIKSEKPYDKFPVNGSKLRNCFISWLIYQKLLTPQFNLTSRGLKILSFLKPGYPDYENDPFSESNSDI